MVLSEFLSAMRLQGASPSETQLRWAIKTGKLPRPRMDAAHRFDFTQADVDLAATFFRERSAALEVACE